MGLLSVLLFSPSFIFPCEWWQLTRSMKQAERMGESTPSSVKFYYEKGKFFKVIHVDGVIGGPTPERAVFVALYNQRSPIPQEIEQELAPDGSLGPELSRKGKDGIFREIEIGIVLTPKAAEEVGLFLLQQARLLHDTDKRLPKDAVAASEEHDEQLSARS
jgi:hypothetical protein